MQGSQGKRIDESHGRAFAVVALSAMVVLLASLGWCALDPRDEGEVLPVASTPAGPQDPAKEPLPATAPERPISSDEESSGLVDALRLEIFSPAGDPLPSARLLIPGEGAEPDRVFASGAILEGSIQRHGYVFGPGIIPDDVTIEVEGSVLRARLLRGREWRGGLIHGGAGEESEIEFRVERPWLPIARRALHSELDSGFTAFERGDDGLLRLVNLPDRGSVYLRVRAPRHFREPEAERYDRRIASCPLSALPAAIVLADDVVVKAHFVDVLGAPVGLTGFRLEWREPEARTASIVESRTDVEGRLEASIPVAPIESLRIRLMRRDVFEREERVAGLVDLGTIILESTRRLRIQVLDAEGRPIVGAIFALDDYPCAPRSDDDGIVAIAGAPAADLRGAIAALGFRPIKVDLPATENEMTVRLDRVGRLEVRLVDEFGRPLRYGEVEMSGPQLFVGPVPWHPGLLHNACGGGVSESRVAADGTSSVKLAPSADDPSLFVVSELSAGQPITLTACSADSIRIPISDPVSFILSEGERREVVLRARSGWQPVVVEGTVVDAGGLPVAGASVMISTPDGGRGVGHRTAKDGSYFFEGVARAPFDIRAELRSSRRGRRPAMRVNPEDKEVLRIDLRLD